MEKLLPFISNVYMMNKMIENGTTTIRVSFSNLDEPAHYSSFLIDLVFESYDWHVKDICVFNVKKDRYESVYRFYGLTLIEKIKQTILVKLRNNEKMNHISIKEAQ